MATKVNLLHPATGMMKPATTGLAGRICFSVRSSHFFVAN